jgi:hypothetical protein
MPSRFNIPAPPSRRLTHEVTEKANSNDVLIVVAARRLAGDKTPALSEGKLQ